MQHFHDYTHCSHLTTSSRLPVFRMISRQVNIL